MSTEVEMQTVLRDLFHSQRFAVLATDDHGQPFASLMAFAATEDLEQIVVLTERATRKFANLKANARVALLIDDREILDLANWQNGRRAAGWDVGSSTPGRNLPLCRLRMSHCPSAGDRSWPGLPLGLVAVKQPLNRRADFATVGLPAHSPAYSRMSQSGHFLPLTTGCFRDP